MSFAFKQSLCHVARRYSQKVKHITEAVFSSYSSQQDWSRQWGKHRPRGKDSLPSVLPIGFFIQLSSSQCTKIPQVVFHFEKEASTHWKFIFIVLLTGSFGAFPCILSASAKYAVQLANGKLEDKSSSAKLVFLTLLLLLFQFLWARFQSPQLPSRNSEEYSMPFENGDPHRRPDGNPWFTFTLTIYLDLLNLNKKSAKLLSLDTTCALTCYSCPYHEQWK